MGRGAKGDGVKREWRITALSVSCADSSPRGRAKGEALAASQKSTVGADGSQGETSVPGNAKAGP